MLLAEVLGFWIVVGVAFFGLRRLGDSKPSRTIRVVPRANGRRA